MKRNIDSEYILHPFRRWAPRVHAAADGAQMDFPKGCCAEQMLSMERRSPPFDHLSYSGISSQENNSLPKGPLRENFLLHG